MVLVSNFSSDEEVEYRMPKVNVCHGICRSVAVVWAHGMRKILILTLVSLGVLLGASPANANHPAPTGLSVTGKTTNSVSLDWNDYPRGPSAIRQYRVQVYSSAGTLLPRRVTGSTTSAYTATGLSPSTGYRFAVAVQFLGGHVSKYSTQVSTTTNAAPVSCPEGQYKAEYFANETLSGSPGIMRCEASVNNTWADGQSPGTGIPHEDFSARYTGRIRVARGDYEFKVTVDDGARLYVDGELVIDKWFQQAPTTYTAKRTLAAGFHDIKIEYYDTHLSGTIRLEIMNVTPPDPPPPPSGEPGPIAGQGYSRVFADEFDTIDRSTWCPRQWWEGGPPAGSQTVLNGELRLRRTRATNYANTTMSTEPCRQANPKSFRQGYFEARMRSETVHGNGPAWWLFSTRHATNPSWPSLNPICQQTGEPSSHCISGEIDVYEGFGRIDTATGSASDFFNSGIHRNSSNGYGVPNEMRLVQHRTGVNLAEWHVYAAKWTTSQVSLYIDGQLQGTVNTFDSTDQPMHLILSNWTTGWENENVPNSSTEPELDTFVDWVRVWQQ
jgi:hypothetical protein